MAATPLTYTYTTRAAIERMLSAAGVRDRLDDDEDQLVTSAEEDALDDIIADATDTVNFYCWSKYAPEQLATSNLIERMTTKLAAWELCRRRGNPAPDALTEMAQEVQEMLQRVYENNHPLPGIALRRVLAPAWSNVRCDPRYQFKVIRVERGTSTSEPTQQTAQPQFPDYQEGFAWEI